MASNIEIKARVKDVKAMQKRIEKIAGKYTAILHQEDMFFHAPNGRLKLRTENDRPGQLLFYIREDIPGPRKSVYEIVQVSDTKGLKGILSAALGVRGIVKKERRLYMHGNSRIHLDKIANLGHFIELEVVQTINRSKQDPNTQAARLMKELGIMKEDLVSCAYIDLLDREAR